MCVFTLAIFFFGSTVYKKLCNADLAMRWAGHVVRMGDRKDVLRVLLGKPGGKRPLGRPRRRWEDNTEMDLQVVGCGVWTGSSWFRIGTGGGHL